MECLKITQYGRRILVEERWRRDSLLAENENFLFSQVNDLGQYSYDDSFNDKHIDQILKLDLIDVSLVKSAGFKVVLDAVNSTGGFMVPKLLDKMGVECVRLFCEPNGDFPQS